MRFRIVFPGLAQFPPMTRDWERQLDPDDLHRIAEILDRSAFDGIYVQEHIAIPQADVETFGARYLDALTAMAFLAGATRRLLLTSNVIVLPFHPPVAHAKAVASLDVMSGGRVIVCYGVGHFAAEFVAVGASYQHRGAVMDESLEVLKLLWTEDVPTYRSERFEIADLVSNRSRIASPIPRSGSEGTARSPCAGPLVIRDGRHSKSTRGSNCAPTSTTYGPCPSSATASANST